MPAFRALPSGAGRWDGVRHALFGTLPGRAIVIGIVLRLAVYAVGLALGTVPAFLSVIDTAAGLALAIGAVYIVVQAGRPGEAAPALAGAPQADALVRLRRLLSGHADRRLLPAVRIPAVLQLQLVPRAEPSARAGRSGAASWRRARRSRFSAPTAATSPASSNGGRPTRPARFAGVSMAVVPADRTCAGRFGAGDGAGPARVTAGPWAHVNAPAVDSRRGSTVPA